MQEKPNALIWLVLSAIVIALDQLTKHIAIAALQPYAPQPVIPGLLNWTLAYNTGAAFSFLHDAGGWQRWLFTLLAIVVSAVLIVWLKRLPRGAMTFVCGPMRLRAGQCEQKSETGCLAHGP